MDIGQLLGAIVKNNQDIFIRYGVVTAVTTQASASTTATASVNIATRAVTLSAINSAVVAGMAITGTNIAASTYVFSVNGTDVVMTKPPATTNATAALSFFSTRLSIQISGAATAITGIRYLESYNTPAVNDVVVCLLNDNDLIVLGKLT
jgi:hypothetical protein